MERVYLICLYTLYIYIYTYNIYIYTYHFVLPQEPLFLGSPLQHSIFLFGMSLGQSLDNKERKCRHGQTHDEAKPLKRIFIENPDSLSLWPNLYSFGGYIFSRKNKGLNFYYSVIWLSPVPPQCHCFAGHRQSVCSVYHDLRFWNVDTWQWNGFCEV